MERNQIAMTILKKKKKVGGAAPPDAKGYYTTAAVKPVMVLVEGQTHKSVEQNRNRPARIQPTDFWQKSKSNSIE